MDLLLRNKAFWAALIAVVYALVYYFVPGFPKEIWSAIFALAEVIIGALAISDTRHAVVARQASRAAQAPDSGTESRARVL